MTSRILTVGHSTHPIEAFIELLRRVGVTTVVDVRTLPGSRRNPQFNQEALAPALEECDVTYVREQRLGGFRKASDKVAPDVNGFWTNASFHRYADYALGDTFAKGIDSLIGLAAPPELPVIMCSEAVWWRCHRRIIADYLLARGLPVAHVMPDGRTTVATLTSGAVVEGARTITYPSDFKVRQRSTNSGL